MTRQTRLPFGWNLLAILTADLFHAFTGEPHPMRPQPQKAERARNLHARLTAQRERLARQAAAPTPPADGV